MNILSALRSKKLGLFELIAMGYGLYLNKFGIFASVFCITLLPFSIIKGLQPYISFNPNLSILYFFLLLFYFTFVLPAYVSVIAILAESLILAEQPKLQVVFQRVLHRILPLISLNIRFSIIFFLCFFLLVIPGIIYSINNGFYSLSFILRDQRGEGAFQYSRSLVKGNWWRVFFFNLIVLNLFGLQVIIQRIISIFTTSPILIAVISDILSSLVGLGIGISGILLFLNLEYQKR